MTQFTHDETQFSREAPQPFRSSPVYLDRHIFSPKIYLSSLPIFISQTQLLSIYISFDVTQSLLQHAATHCNTRQYVFKRGSRAISLFTCVYTQTHLLSIYIIFSQTHTHTHSRFRCRSRSFSLSLSLSLSFSLSLSLAIYLSLSLSVSLCLSLSLSLSLSVTRTCTRTHSCAQTPSPPLPLHKH